MLYRHHPSGRTKTNYTITFIFVAELLSRLYIYTIPYRYIQCHIYVKGATAGFRVRNLCYLYVIYMLWYTVRVCFIFIYFLNPRPVFCFFSCFYLMAWLWRCSFLISCCWLTVCNRDIRDKTFIVVQFITVQRESSITKVKRNVSSLWLSSILWHSLQRAQIMIRYVLTLFLIQSPYYMITLLWLLSDCFTSYKGESWGWERFVF